MLCRKGLSAAVFSGLLAAAPLMAEEVVARIEILQTGEPANQHNPSCASGDQTALRASDVILQSGAAVIDAHVGVPVASVILENLSPGNKNWLKVRLGLHNGPSFCSTQCVTYPRNVGAKAQACMSETGGDGLRCYSSPGDYDWGRVENFTFANTEKTTVFCARGKNWSHNRNRWFIVKATW